MPTAEIGRWEFYIPDGWEFKDQGIGVSYLEAPDGTKGLYSKTIKSDPPEASAQELAEYVQTVHQGGFEADPDADWAVVLRSGKREGDLYRSLLDLWDESSQYRVLSLVLCNEHQALHLTMHDYACASHEAESSPFVEIERSARLAAGAA